MSYPRLNWERETLRWDHVKKFTRVIRKGDLIECHSNGMSVSRSLEWAMYRGGGESWAVIEEGRDAPVGVFGWTDRGGIWSYWCDLGAAQTRELMRQTPQYVLEMVESANAAGLPHLANYVWEGNHEALAWLRASHCFSLDLDHRYNISNRGFIGFQTKPAEELRRYV